MTAHLTIALDEAQKAQLDAIAEFQEETAEAVVAKAVQDLIEYDKWFRAAVEKGLEDVRQGRTIPHEEVLARALARRLAGQGAAKT